MGWRWRKCFSWGSVRQFGGETKAAGHSAGAAMWRHERQAAGTHCFSGICRLNLVIFNQYIVFSCLLFLSQIHFPLCLFHRLSWDCCLLHSVTQSTSFCRKWMQLWIGLLLNKWRSDTFKMAEMFACPQAILCWSIMSKINENLNVNRF